MSILLKNIILEGAKRDIFIEDGIITKIGSNLDFKARDEIDGMGGKVAMPSLINAHTHSAMSLLRGYGDDLCLKEWLEEKIWPIESGMDEDDIYWGTKLACLEMIKTGTGFFNEMYMFPEAAMKAAQEMGIRALIGMVMFDIVPPKKDGKYIEKLYGKLKKRQGESVRLSVAPHSIYTVSKENLIWASDFARKEKLLIHTHLSETEKEVQDCIEKYKMKPAEFLDEIGFLGNNVILAHCVWVSDGEIKLLAKNGCSAIHNPTSNLKLAVGEIMPYKKMKDAGLNIALGTDGCASNNNLDMFEEIKMASLIQKHRESDPTVMPAQEAIDCATVNGARFFHLGSGAIKEGEPADVILMDMDDLSMIPHHNILSDIVYSVSGGVVTDLISNGKLIMRNRDIDGEEEIKKEARKRAVSLVSRFGK